MLNGPVKFIVGAAGVALMAGSILSNKVTPPAQSAHAASSPQSPAAQRSWWSDLFGGIEINRGPAPAPAAAQPQNSAGSGYGRMELTPDAGGQYHTAVEIEGQRIDMLVDTGATLVSLTGADASRLGVRPAPSDFSIPIQTANGMAKAARTNLREVRLGTLEVRNVDAIVLPDGVTGTSLLGMSFLKKLGGFEVASGNLQLRQ